MTNQIKRQCPVCKCPEGDVLAIIQEKDVKYVLCRCLVDGRKHQYKIELTDPDKTWQKFFKPEAYESD